MRRMLSFNILALFQLTQLESKRQAFILTRKTNLTRRLAMNKITKSSKTKPAQLTLLNPERAGIDIGAKELFVCIAKSSSKHEVRSFPTFTEDLKRMITWLKESGVKSVAMESTGAYWIVPFEMLDEAGIEVLLVNARFFKSVPGRKTDVQDCQWIQQLHSYGLLRGSFRPSNEIVELRSYVRQRSR